MSAYDPKRTSHKKKRRLQVPPFHIHEISSGFYGVVKPTVKTIPKICAEYCVLCRLIQRSWAFKSRTCPGKANWRRPFAMQYNTA